MTGGLVDHRGRPFATRSALVDEWGLPISSDLEQELRRGNDLVTTDADLDEAAVVLETLAFAGEVSIPNEPEDDTGQVLREIAAKLRQLASAARRLAAPLPGLEHAGVQVAVIATQAECRVCGCTDLDCRRCVERTGEACTWIEDDLCSACVNLAGVRHAG